MCWFINQWLTCDWNIHFSILELNPRNTYQLISKTKFRVFHSFVCTVEPMIPYTQAIFDALNSFENAQMIAMSVVGSLTGFLVHQRENVAFILQHIFKCSHSVLSAVSPEISWSNKLISLENEWMYKKKRN